MDQHDDEIIRTLAAGFMEAEKGFRRIKGYRQFPFLTNAIENFNRQLRKVTKTKSAFVSDDALMKILYLATMSIVDKWTMPVKECGMILDNLMIYFGDRVKITL